MKSLSQEEAIAILSDMKIDIPVPKAAVTQKKRNVALDMAISALSCSEIPNSSDSISRQAAIDDLQGKDPSHIWDTADIEVWVNDLPPAQPERKKGRWIPQDFNKSDGMITTAVYYYPKCSLCGWTSNYTNFCPNCGADMIGEQE